MLCEQWLRLVGHQWVTDRHSKPPKSSTPLRGAVLGNYSGQRFVQRHPPSESTVAECSTDYYQRLVHADLDPSRCNAVGHSPMRPEGLEEPKIFCFGFRGLEEARRGNRESSLSQPVGPKEYLHHALEDSCSNQGLIIGINGQANHVGFA